MPKRKAKLTLAQLCAKHIRRLRSENRRIEAADYIANVKTLNPGLFHALKRHVQIIGHDNKSMHPQ